MTLAAAAGALLDLFGAWSWGLMTGIGIAMGLCVVVLLMRAFGGWFE